MLPQRTNSLALRDEQRSNYGDVIKGITYGGLDGILTAFAIAAGATGGSLLPSVVVLIGLSNVASAFPTPPPLPCSSASCRHSDLLHWERE